MIEAKFSDNIDLIKTWLGSGSINVFGRPWAGKDTNAKELAKLFNGVVIGGGDILRNSPELAALNAKVADGSLAPQGEFLKAILPYFSRDEIKNQPLILSAVGRWHGEEPGIIEATNTSGHPIKAALSIIISEDEIHRRWAIAQETRDRGDRPDDDAEKLDKRIDEFKNKTIPVLTYYRKQGLLIEINGSADKYTVLQEIIDKLADMAKHS